MIDDPLELRRAIDTVLASQELVRLADETYMTKDYQQSVQTLDAATWSLDGKGSFGVEAGERVFIGTMHSFSLPQIILPYAKVAGLGLPEEFRACCAQSVSYPAALKKL